MLRCELACTLPRSENSIRIARAHHRGCLGSTRQDATLELMQQEVKRSGGHSCRGKSLLAAFTNLQQRM